MACRFIRIKHAASANYPDIKEFGYLIQLDASECQPSKFGARKYAFNLKLLIERQDGLKAFAFRHV